MVQLNALLHVTLSKFNPCKREIVFIAGMFSCIALTGYLSVKTLNDFTVYLHNMI